MEMTSTRLATIERLARRAREADLMTEHLYDDAAGRDSAHAFAQLLRTHVDAMDEAVGFDEMITILGTLDGISAVFSHKVIGWDSLTDDHQKRYRQGWDQGVAAGEVVAALTLTTHEI